MRNLKKILALVLALMMALSVMVFASATNLEDYADSEQVSEEYAEAVDVLSGMGILKGSEGKLYPKDYVQRSHVSTMIYRMMSTDVADAQVHIYEDYGMFDDVSEDNWFAGFVNYSANNELVKGVGDNKFNPSGYMTGYELITILLRAIGYDQKNEISGSDWKITAAGLAKQAGILGDFNETTLGSYLTREQIAYLMFNAINVPQVTYTPALGYETDDLFGNLNDSIGQEHFGLTSTTSYIVGNQATGESATVLGYDGNTWNDRAYTAANGANNESFAFTTGLEEFGHQTKVWFDRTAQNTAGTYTTVYATMDQATNSSITYAEYAALTPAERTAYVARSTYHDDFAAASSSGVAVSPNVAQYNMVVNNADGTKALVGLWLVVDRYTAINNYATTKTVSFGTDIGTGVAQSKVDGFEALTLGDYVNGVRVTGTAGSDATKGADGYYKWNVSVLSAVVGTVSYVDSSDNTITLNGTEVGYSYDALYNTAHNDGLTIPGKDGAATWNFSATYTVYTDILGNYVAAVPVSTFSYLKATYGYFVTDNAAGTVKYYLQGVDATGTTVTVQLANVAEYNKLATAGGTTYLDYGTNQIVAPTKNVGRSSVILNAQPNGTYTIAHYAGDGTCTSQSAVVDQIYQNVVNDLHPAAGDPAVTTSTVALGTNNNYFFTDSTKFVFVSGYGENLSVVTKTGLADLVGSGVSYTLPGNSVVIAHQDYSISTGSNNFAIDTVIVHGNYASTGSLVYFEDATQDGTNANGQVFNGYINGTETQITVNSAATDYVAPVANNFFEYTVDANGVYTLTNVTSDTSKCKIGQLSVDPGTNYSVVCFADGTQLPIASSATIVNLTTNTNAPTTAAALVEAAEQNTITVAAQIVGGTVTVVYITTMA